MNLSCKSLLLATLVVLFALPAMAGGYSIDFTGGLDESGAMVLNGKINYYKPGKSFPFRGTWTPNEDGSVRQFFEQFDTEKDQWIVWFDGVYERR